MSTNITNLEGMKQRLLDDSNNYRQKAKEYYQQGEIEGTLINYLLSSSNLYNYMQIDSLGVKEKSEADKQMKENISYIVPLQEKLQELKRNRGCDKNDDENDTSDCPKPEDIPDLDFDQISGQEIAKQQIKNGILYPTLYPKLYPYQSKGILFYGPPGTGKTLLAKAFVNELQQEALRCYDKNIKVLLYAPTGGELKGKYVGETEKNIKKYFNCANEQAKKCMENSDKDGLKVISVIFLDEVEAIAGDRSADESGMMTNSVNALLQLMDGVKSYPNVIVMAATNYPWSLDAAILRRFDTKIYVTLPTPEDIKVLIKIEVNEYIKKALKIYKNVNKDEETLALEDQKALVAKVNSEANSKNSCSDEKGQQSCGGEQDVCCGNNICIKYREGESGISNDDFFNTFRNKYFPQFNDEELIKIGKMYSGENYLFGGGDVKNACRAVFKMMAKEAMDNRKFKKDSIINPFSIKKDGGEIITENIKEIRDEKKDAEFYLYSDFGEITNQTIQKNNLFFIYYEEGGGTGPTNKIDVNHNGIYYSENYFFNWNIISSKINNDPEFISAFWQSLSTKMQDIDEHLNAILQTIVLEINNKKNEYEKLSQEDKKTFPSFNDYYYNKMFTEIYNTKEKRQILSSVISIFSAIQNLVNYLDSPSVFIEYQPILTYTAKCLTVTNEIQSQKQAEEISINSLVHIDFNSPSFINSIQKYIKDINFIGNTFLKIPLKFETKKTETLVTQLGNQISNFTNSKTTQNAAIGMSAGAGLVFTAVCAASMLTPVGWAATGGLTLIGAMSGAKINTMRWNTSDEELLKGEEEGEVSGYDISEKMHQQIEMDMKNVEQENNIKQRLYKKATEIMTFIPSRIGYDKPGNGNGFKNSFYSILLNNKDEGGTVVGYSIKLMLQYILSPDMEPETISDTEQNELYKDIIHQAQNYYKKNSTEGGKCKLNLEKLKGILEESSKLRASDRHQLTITKVFELLNQIYYFSKLNNAEDKESRDFFVILSILNKGATPEEMSLDSLFNAINNGYFCNVRHTYLEDSSWYEWNKKKDKFLSCLSNNVFVNIEDKEQGKSCGYGADLVKQLIKQRKNTQFSLSVDMAEQVNLLLGKGEQTPKWDFSSVGGPFDPKGDILSEPEAYKKLQSSEYKDDQELLNNIKVAMNKDVESGNGAFYDTGGSVRIFCYRQQDYGSSLDSYNIQDIINGYKEDADAENPVPAGLIEDGGEIKNKKYNDREDAEEDWGDYNVLDTKAKKDNDSSPDDWKEAGSYIWMRGEYPIYIRKSTFERRKSQIQEKRKRYFCEKTAHLNVSERYYSEPEDCSSYDSSSRYGGMKKTKKIKSKSVKKTAKKQKYKLKGGFVQGRCQANKPKPEDLISFNLKNQLFYNAVNKNNTDHVRGSITSQKLAVLDKYQRGEELTKEDKKT